MQLLAKPYTRFWPIAARRYVSANRKTPPHAIIRSYKDKVKVLTDKLVSQEEELFAQHRKSAEENQSIINVIEKAICKGGKAQMIKVGSLCTQLAMDSSSDFDICFLTKDKAFLNDFKSCPDFKAVFMHTIMEQVQQLGQIDPNLTLDGDIFPLIYARVPLLIIPFKNGVRMDIQFPASDYHAIRNTNLIRHYSAADVRFRQLYLWARTLFNRMGVKNSKEGLFSSYHIILLVVHFLQSKTTPPVLPILAKTHEKLVGPEIPLDTVLAYLKKPFDTLIDWRSENKSSVGELVIEFIDYYSTFNPSKNAISISNGRTFSRKQYASDTRLLMYDPFSSKTVSISTHIADALSIVSTYVKNRQCEGEFIDSFPDLPEASKFRYSINHKEFKPKMQ